jgi:maltooligosyltrehalose trehalohydrolase
MMKMRTMSRSVRKTTAAVERQMPVGAEVTPGGVHFRVWAPKRRRVDVVLELPDGPLIHPLEAEGDGYFSGLVEEARAGHRYRFQLDESGGWFPDPASRFQPDGPHGPSEIIDAGAFAWTDADWQGLPLEGQIIYEMHIGTFTHDGTWASAMAELPELAAAGMTVLEVMPIADFPGRFGWGYDGVGMYAPVWLYGRPDDLRRFVDRAHSLGMAVILDVVYNHFGPDGNYLTQYADDYFTRKYDNEWGDALNFDGENSRSVREYFIENAGYWIREYHLDGLRLDATQQIFDDSPDHIIAAVARTVRKTAQRRHTIIVAENEPQNTKLARAPESGGYGVDALWNDDLHHSAMVALTGRKEAYYTDYRGAPQEFISAAKYGYLFQGQRYKWQKKRRGAPGLDLRPAQYVNFIQNHDQVANSLAGKRVDTMTTTGRLRALTAYLLLAPGTPMLFQGQEFASSKPFHYFGDHRPELAKLVLAGRIKFLKQFRSLMQPEVQPCFIDPGSPSIFETCKLDFSERQTNAAIYQLHKDLLRLRREDPIFRMQRPRGVDGAVLGDEAFLLRYFSDQPEDRLLLVNLGRDLHFDPAPEPLLAPPEDRRWYILWSSEDPKYGGVGTFPLDTQQNWRLPGQAAVALKPGPLTPDEVETPENE